MVVTKGAQFDQFDCPRTLRTHVSIYNIDFIMLRFCNEFSASADYFVRIHCKLTAWLETIEGEGRGGGIAQSGEGATPGEEVPGSIPAMATRSLLVGSVSV